MTTANIIEELNHLTIDSSEDYARLDRLDELTALLPENHDGYLACEALLKVLERHPGGVEFGAPGQLVHTIESYSGQYEALLRASLDRQPTFMTIWMLHRLINAATGAGKSQLVAHLHRLQTHPRADEQAKAAAEEFYRFQTKEA